jgi:hypothetical protein
VKTKTTFWIAVIALFVAAPLAGAQTPSRTLEERVTQLERKVRRMDSIISVGIISAVICAWWAQNTARNAWLWFFAGLIFSVISLLVLLHKNAEDIRARGAAARPPPRT